MRTVPKMRRPEQGVLAGIVLLAMIATALLLSGFEGSLAITAHRSGHFMLDATGLLIAAAAVLVGARLVALMVQSIVDLPRPDVQGRCRVLAARGEDSIRWRRVAERLGQVSSAD